VEYSAAMRDLAGKDWRIGKRRARFQEYRDDRTAPESSHQPTDCRWNPDDPIPVNPLRGYWFITVKEW